MTARKVRVGPHGIPDSDYPRMPTLEIMHLAAEQRATQLRHLRGEALKQLEQQEQHRPDPRDELAQVVQMAEAFGWEYVKIPTWVARLAIEALHPVVQNG
jgi:hypothetical protein